MCGPTQGELHLRSNAANKAKALVSKTKAPIGMVLPPPSPLARYACAMAMISIFGLWGDYAITEDFPQERYAIHSWKLPMALTMGYLGGLPILRKFTQTFLSESVDVKLLLKETMVVYNGGQVLLNVWMVYRIIACLAEGHPFIGDVDTVTPGMTFAVWIHYMDKYLEFFDTFFMILRGRMDQVSFLHVYHHVSIAWAWWFALYSWPGGDNYFGALLNSWIHVMMYSYYTLSLLKISCPWKRYLTQCQLLQFCTVVGYTIFCAYINYQNGQLDFPCQACIFVQSFEMISLFFLFMHFYNKAYKNKKGSKKAAREEAADTVPEQVSISSESSDDVKKDN